MSIAQKSNDAMGMSREGLHIIKAIKIPLLLMKLELAKDYDIFNWLYMKLLLIHIGMSVQLGNWFMGCLSSTTFAVLIDGSTPRLFFVASFM